MNQGGYMSRLMTSEYQDRVKEWLEVLQNDFYLPLGEIPMEYFRTFDELTYGEASQMQYEPAAPGMTWGRTWEYAWFRGKIVLPEAAEGRRIVVDLQPGGEATLFVNGTSFGTYRAPWVEYPHQYIEDNCLTRCGKAGESYEILMEVYAGHWYPERPGGGCSTGPVLKHHPVLRPDREEGHRVVLGHPTYGIWNEDAYQLFIDADTLVKLGKTLDETSLRASKIAEALEAFTRIADPEIPDLEERCASYRAARAAMAPALAAVNGSTAPVFYAIGNAHIDLAWLWPMQETYRKSSRTFAAQLRLLEEYPDYKFLQSQPALYEMCREHYPELFERIRAAICEGRWIAEGAMWVEPDTNMSGGEALIRQLLYGKQYYRDVLGVDSRILWLPDTFGYSAVLPQILRGCGVKYLVTQKIFWSYNDCDRFPYNYFNWEGMDGSVVEAFLPTSYSYMTDPASIKEAWKSKQQVRDLDAFLLPFGYGDGGGGPTRDHLEYLEREQDLEGMPRVRMESPEVMFEALDAEGGPKNTYTGELYFTAHRGTYTSQAEIKKNNRKGELALREMEFWDAASVILRKKEADQVKIGDEEAHAAMDEKQGADQIVPEDEAEDLHENDALWKELLLNQFHDILPGSGIARIYQESDARMKRVIARAEEKAAGYAGRFLEERGDGAVTVFNSLSFERTVLVQLPEAFREGVLLEDGTPVPSEAEEDGVLAEVTLPSAGAVTLHPAGKKAAVGTAPAVTVTCDNDNFVLQNELVRAVVNPSGEVISFVLRESGREFAAAPMNHFRLFKDVPRMFDAWDIDENYREQELPGAEHIAVKIVRQGLEGVLSVEGTIGHSTYRQEISLKAGSRRIEFSTTIDWKELHRLLKVSFPVEIYTTEGINEIQFGYVTRPNKRSRQYDRDRFEVCNHRYSALADGSHGAAVLNDCKYGISMNDNALELTLLRAPASPEMRADNHVHHFTYAFTAFEGPFVHSDVVSQGYDLNVPAKVLSGSLPDATLGRMGLVTLEPSDVYLDTLKLAEDGSGDLILRFYEAMKSSVTARIHTAFRGRAWRCDMLENKQQELAFTDGTLSVPFHPFEIVTLRIREE